MRAVEHAGAIGAGRRVGELCFRRLFDDAVVLLQRADRLFHRDRIADLNRGRQRRLRRNRMEFPVVLVREVERIRGSGLCDDDARTLRDEAERLHHVEARAKRAHVSEISAWDDDDVGHRPVELLHDLDADGLLSFEAQAVHRVREVDALLDRQPLHDRHAAVEIGIERQHERAVRERLHKLRCRDFAARQNDDRRNLRRGRICGERRRRVARRGARDGAHRLVVGHHLPHDGDQHRHPEIFERAGVRLAAHLDPELVHAELAAEALGPHQVRAPFVHRDDVLVANAGAHPFLLAPHGRPVGPFRALVPAVEQLLPRLGGTAAQRGQIVRHFEQVAARRAAVERLLEVVFAVAAGDALENGSVFHGVHVHIVT